MTSTSPIVPAMKPPRDDRPPRVLVAGAGVFGLAAALELSARGHAVTVLDPGPVPHPDAASTDISKMVRMDYGDDDLYVSLGAEALDRWREWNRTWTPGLFHETGFLILSSGAWAPGAFEYDSYHTLRARGQPVEILNPREVPARFPAWTGRPEWRGYVNPRAGWAESGRVVQALAGQARAQGVAFVTEDAFAGFLERGSRVHGVRTTRGREIEADRVVLATGAWTPLLLPELADRMWPVGQPVFHFQVSDAPHYRPPHFLPWAADISTAGWYGFPAFDDGTLKISNHGPGIHVDPRGPRTVPAEAEAHFRSFLADALPDVKTAPVLRTRLCLYTETFDNDFWIDRDPRREGVVVATGGSGHGFKFTPVLGPIIADAVEGKAHPRAERFRWRPLGVRRVEPARFAGAEEPPRTRERGPASHA